MWVPHRQCATCGPVRGNTNTCSAHHGGCKGGAVQLGYFDLAKSKSICDAFSCAQYRSPVFPGRESLIVFFPVDQSASLAPGTPRNLFFVRSQSWCNFFT
ncbi:unnamed protein product [Ectocarpus sp. 12 AP-2014]